MVAASSGVPPPGRKKQTALEKLHADIRQLQETITRVLSSRRMLATVSITRAAYDNVETKLTTVFQADK